MAVNYLQYIGSMQRNGAMSPCIRFLVSGADTRVRWIVGQNIVSSAYNRGLTLFVLDNTQNNGGIQTGFGRYRVINAVSGEVNLCKLRKRDRAPFGASDCTNGGDFGAVWKYDAGRMEVEAVGGNGQPKRRKLSLSDGALCGGERCGR